MLSCCIRTQQICPCQVTMTFSDAERTAYQISEGFICTPFQTSHDRNIKTSHYPQHSCTVCSPCFLWIIKNRHITLQGWKSGGMLQMLLSKTLTSGVCFSSFFFYKEGTFFTACICFDRVAVCVCVCVWAYFKARWGLKAECQGLSDVGCWVGWILTGWLFGWSPAQTKPDIPLSPSFSLYLAHFSLLFPPVQSLSLSIPLFLPPWSDGLRH